MSILLGLEPFRKFGVGGWWVVVVAFYSSTLVQTLDLDLKLGPSWTKMICNWNHLHVSVRVNCQEILNDEINIDHNMDIYSPQYPPQEYVVLVWWLPGPGCHICRRRSLTCCGTTWYCNRTCPWQGTPWPPPTCTRSCPPGQTCTPCPGWSPPPHRQACPPAALSG